MATVTSTTLAAAINTIFLPGYTKTFYEGTPLLKLLGWPFQQGSGDSIDWKLNYAGGTASLISEGDALPAASNLSFADMTISPQLITSVRKITGHAQDYMGDAYFDGVKAELDGGVSALLHKVEEYCIAQLEAAVDDSATYAGQTRATVNALSDITAGGSANPTLAVLSEMYETLTIAPRAVEYDPNDHMIISAPEQITNYTQVATALQYGADDETAGVNRPYAMSTNDPVLDAGLMKHAIRYNNLPWYSIATMTNTLIMLVKRSDILTRQFGKGLEIKPLARVDDADSFQFRVNVGLAYKDPYRAGKIETLTT